ncbi:hypothetical protein ACIBK9_28940 [Nonomuraea sp. NPDC050227]|uniref:hypothetical protein n=1 Tax=Nonomuraea sp. NPDC050227 TaxID=3364360 RepID=UPI0037B6A4F5
MEHHVSGNLPGTTQHTTENLVFEKLQISYYFDIKHLPFADLFESCTSVLDIKQAMTDWLGDRGRRDIRGAVHSAAHVEGDVIVQRGAVVEAGSYIEGPALICAGAVVRSHAYIRDNVIIGPRCKIGHCTEVTRSIIMSESQATHMVFIGDSVVGSHVNIGSSCVTTNLRVDRPVQEPAVDEISVNVDGHPVPTGYTKFGAVIGDHAQLPALISTSPGTLIGPRTVIYPRNQIGGVLPADSRIR